MIGRQRARDVGHVWSLVTPLWYPASPPGIALDQRDRFEFGRASLRGNAPVDKENRALAYAERFGNVVIGEKYRGAPIGKGPQQVAELFGPGRIDAREWFVAHEDLGPTCQSSSELQAPSLASRQGAGDNVQSSGKAHAVRRVLHVVQRHPRDATIRFQVEANREIPQNARTLGYVSNPGSRSAPEGPASDVSTVEAHASSIGDQVADDGSKQRRLSGAGGAKDAHDFTGVEGDIYPSQYLLSGPFDADTRCGDDRLLRHGPLATGTAPLTCVSDTLPVASSMRALSAVIQLWPRASLTPPRRSNTCRTRSTSTAGDSACTPRTSAVTPPDPRPT